MQLCDLFAFPPAPTIEFEQASYQVREPPGPDGIEVLNIKVIRRGDLDRTSKIRCSTRDGSAQSGVDYNPKSRVLKFTPGQCSEFSCVLSTKTTDFETISILETQMIISKEIIISLHFLIRV